MGSWCWEFQYGDDMHQVSSPVAVVLIDAYDELLASEEPIGSPVEFMDVDGVTHRVIPNRYLCYHLEPYGC